MTTEQIRQACIDLDPARTYSADKAAWYVPAKGKYERYRLSCQPGLDGTNCQGWDADNFEDCLAQFERALLNPAPANHE